MTIYDQLQSACSNVGRRKLRSTLASLGVLVGTVTIVVMVSLASGVREQINRQFASIGLDRLVITGGGNGRGFGPPRAVNRRKLLTADDAARWRGLPGVKELVAEVDLPAAVEMELRWKGTNQVVRMGGGDFRAGSMFQAMPEAVAGTLDLPESGGLILSQGVAQGAGLSSNDYAVLPGQTAEVVLKTSRGENQGYSLKVVGISQERAPVIQVSARDRVAMKNWWFNTTNVVEREGYDSITIRTVDVRGASEISTQLRQEGYQVQSLEFIMTAANRIVTMIVVVFTLIGSIALLVATIGIANTMVMAIYERTREIGILKAMGATRGEIRRMFMMEAGLIGMIGGVAGLLVGWLLGLVLNGGIQLYLRYRDMPSHGSFFVVTLPLALGVILFATGIGLLAGLLPAQRAARLDPLEALRHE